MRITIEKLRTGIVVIAVLLIAGILGFLGYARHQRRFLAKDLPAKLGIHIQSSADEFTYSQAGKGGKPMFLLRASKVVRFKGNRASLHDVNIILYGPSGDRGDRIYGKDFDYDQSTGIAQAKGEVQIDLGIPTQQNGNKVDNKTSQTDALNQKSTVHVKTSDLVFNQNTGVATTQQQVEFHFPQAAGTAKGANYDSHNGVLILQENVQLSSSVQGNTLSLRASHAQVMRGSEQCYLDHVTTEFRDERGVADQAVVHFRKDGSAELVEAKGNIRFTRDAGEELTSQLGEIHLDEHSQPKLAHFSHGVLLSSKDNSHHLQGNSAEAFVDFMSKSMLKHARFVNTVSFVDQQFGLPGDPHGSLTREVRGSQVDIDFVSGSGNQSVPQRALVQGGGHMSTHALHSKGPQQQTTMDADMLLASFTPDRSISDLTGTGHTRLTDLGADGSMQTSTGDSLQIHFNSKAKPQKEKAKSGKSVEASSAGLLDSESAQIQSAIQTGHVTLVQQPPAGKVSSDGSPLTALTATADKADFQSAQGILRLSGNPHIHDGAMDLTAQAVEYFRNSGDSNAMGNVKATYLQVKPDKQKGGNAASNAVFGGQGPIHIIAAKAHLDHATGDATFTGQARLWQENNSISAPSLELSRAHQLLKARSEGSAAQVHAVFLSKPDGKQGPALVRIGSHELIYSEGERKGVFRGAVTVQNGDAVIRSNQTEVFLAEASTPSNDSSRGSRSQVDRMVATGSVAVTQQNRKATGDKLVYTAADERFILTGTNSVPPHLYDQAHGNVTGDALIFNNRDDSVNVEGQGRKSVTQTRAPK